MLHPKRALFQPVKTGKRRQRKGKRKSKRKRANIYAQK